MSRPSASPTPSLRKSAPGLSVGPEDVGVLRRAVAVDGVEQALALVAGVEAVGVDLGQRAVRGEGQVLQVARQAEQRRVAGLGVDAGDDDRVGADALAALAAVAAEQQDVDPLLVAERVGDVVDGGRLPSSSKTPAIRSRCVTASRPTRTAGAATTATQQERRRGAPSTCWPRPIRAAAAASGSRRRRPRPTAGRPRAMPPTTQSSGRCRPRCGRRSAVRRWPATRRRRRGRRNSTRVTAPSTRRPAARKPVPGRTALSDGPARARSRSSAPRAAVRRAGAPRRGRCAGTCRSRVGPRSRRRLVIRP